jgi:hypothetical protein
VTAHRLTAYRVWAFDPPAKSPLLKSLHNATLWLPNEWTRADCSRKLLDPDSPHDPPAERCTCGIYAAKTLAIPVMMAGGLSHLLIGRVELAGKVIEHDLGYRAERARVVELLPKPGQESPAEWIAGVYDIPVSHDVIDRWDSFPKPAQPPAPAPSAPKHRVGHPYPMPKPRYSTGDRIGLALFALIFGSLIASVLHVAPMPTTPVTVPAAAAAPAFPPSGLPMTCPNTNPMNCYLDPAVLTREYDQLIALSVQVARAQEHTANWHPSEVPRTPTPS